SNGNQEEDAKEYTVNWAVADGSDSNGATCSLGGGTGGAQFLHVAGTHTFYAVGTSGATVWVLNNTSMGAGTFTTSTAYCFQARSFNTLASTTHPSGWYDYTDNDGNPAAVTATSGSSFCSSGCTTVSGTVTIPAGVTIASGAPLYVGFYQQLPTGNGPSALYATQLTPASGANSYSITIPSGSNYYIFGILDQNNDGQIDVGDATNLVNDQNSTALSFSGSTQPGINLTLPGPAAPVAVTTQYQSCGSSCSGYSLYLEVDESDKLPVGVTLYSGPNFLNGIDIGRDVSTGHSGRFDISAGTLGATPSVGDAYKFTVTYSDGSVDQGSVGAVNGTVIGWNGGGTVGGPANAPTGLTPTGTIGSDQPSFSWTDPASSQGSSFYYSFYINPTTNCSGNCNIWQVPSQDSNSYGFSSSTSSLAWGIDPSDSNNTPTLNPLTSGEYSWSIEVQDTNGNQVQSSTNFTAP
ncbi:MAG: hypothetical protein ACRD3S_07675, partial [Terracidiphilus sp.]